MSTFQEKVWPLKQSEEVFILLYITAKCDPTVEISFISKTFNELYGFTFTECDIENCLNKFTNFNN